MSQLSRILLVEDEKNIRDVVKLNLELEGYEVVAVDNGPDAIKRTQEEVFHLVVLDVMLPNMDGFEICETIRIRDDNTPILFLTAKDSYDDKIKGLKKGADDYLTKPFNLEEFLLRVKNLVRRNLKGTSEGKESLQTYSFGGNEINFVTFRAKGIHGDVDLTKKEVALMKLLIERKNEVVSRNDILKIVWGYDVFPSTRTIDNFILNFRKHFELDPKNPVHFISIRSVGYKFIENEK
ncbi:MAG TPA: response regulator transcription factor [Chitinophagales bacterium]|nr:response regulator transcription factor [Chitinophagales bacterium]